jgi:HSP20 family protein
VSGRRDDIERLQDEIEELFQDLWRVPRFSGLRPGFRPSADCFRTGDELVVVVELAGIAPDAIDLRVDGRTLVVAGERRRPFPGERLTYSQLEIEYGPFQRRIGLAEEIDPSAASATYEHGLLTVRLPIAARPAEAEHARIVVVRR